MEPLGLGEGCGGLGSLVWFLFLVLLSPGFVVDSFPLGVFQSFVGTNPFTMGAFLAAADLQEGIGAGGILENGIADAIRTVFGLAGDGGGESRGLQMGADIYLIGSLEHGADQVFLLGADGGVIFLVLPAAVGEDLRVDAEGGSGGIGAVFEGIAAGRGPSGTGSGTGGFLRVETVGVDLGW